MNKLITRLIPFVFIGIVITLLWVGVVVFSYLLVIGALVGLTLFSIAWLRAKLFPPKYAMKTHYKVKRGRIIEHDDYKY